MKKYNIKYIFYLHMFQYPHNTEYLTKEQMHINETYLIYVH